MSDTENTQTPISKAFEAALNGNNADVLLAAAKNTVDTNKKDAGLTVAEAEAFVKSTGNKDLIDAFYKRINEEARVKGQGYVDSSKLPSFDLSNPNTDIPISMGRTKLLGNIAGTLASRTRDNVINDADLKLTLKAAVDIAMKSAQNGTVTLQDIENMKIFGADAPLVHKIVSAELAKIQPETTAQTTAPNSPATTQNPSTTTPAAQTNVATAADPVTALVAEMAAGRQAEALQREIDAKRDEERRKEEEKRRKEDEAKNSWSGKIIETIKMIASILIPLVIKDPQQQKDAMGKMEEIFASDGDKYNLNPSELGELFKLGSIAMAGGVKPSSVAPQDNDTPSAQPSAP